MRPISTALLSSLILTACWAPGPPRQMVYRTPTTVVVPTETRINEIRNDTFNTNIESTTNSTSTSTTHIITNHPEALTSDGQQVDNIQKFDRNGNPNYDENGGYIGGHGLGTTIDNPDAP